MKIRAPYPSPITSIATDLSGFRITPSILSAGFTRSGEEVCRVPESGASWIHFDVVDNHYVPSLTVGPLVRETVHPHARKNGKPVPIDVYLMASPVGRIIPDLAKTGADLITFHPEVSEHIDRSLALTHDDGCKAGLIFNPAAPLHYLDHAMDRLDMVLIMSINPGFGGQSLIPEASSKLRAVCQKSDAYQDKTGRRILLEIDGGVRADNIAEVTKTGADTFVVGSTVFGKPNAGDGYRDAIGALYQALASLA